LNAAGRLLAVGMSNGFALWDLATFSELAFMPMTEGTLGVIDVWHDFAPGNHTAKPVEVEILVGDLGTP
jgi:hypothetical protein